MTRRRETIAKCVRDSVYGQYVKKNLAEEKRCLLLFPYSSVLSFLLVSKEKRKT